MSHGKSQRHHLPDQSRSAVQALTTALVNVLLFAPARVDAIVSNHLKAIITKKNNPPIRRIGAMIPPVCAMAIGKVLQVMIIQPTTQKRTTMPALHLAPERMSQRRA